MDIIIDFVFDVEFLGDKDWSFKRDNLFKFWVEIEEWRCWSLFKMMSIFDLNFLLSKFLILLIEYLLIFIIFRILGLVLKYVNF